MAKNRSLAYALADNIIGFDDGYESLGERAGAALRDDPLGVLRTVGGSIYGGIRDFAGDFVRNPAGAVTDTANELGLGYVEAGKRLSGGIGAYTDQGMSVDEARDAQLMDALTVSELLGGGVFANQLRRGIMPSVDVDGSGPADPSRREFLKRSAATAGVAAVAPDAVREIMDVLPGAARRAVGANPLGAAVSQISKLRKQADEMSEVAAGRGELPFGNRDEYRRATFAKYDEIADTRSAALDALDADTLANASDADLDTFVREFYDYNLSGYDSVNSSDFEHPAYDALVMEMQKRGLHKQTDRQGLDKYPYARAMVEDYGIKTRKEGEFPRPADIDAETANKRIADVFSHAAQLRDAKLNAVRDNLPVTRVADYDNAVRDVKVAMERLEGIQNMLKDPEVNPFDVIDEKMAAIDEAVPLLANNRGGVSLTNPRTEAMITPSMENPGKFRISYIDRKSGEPMGDTENFETMEAAIRDAMGQGYLTLGRFEPQNFAMGGGVGSLSREARDMFRGPRGVESLSRFAEGGAADDDREALEALANVEYAADMQKYLDPIARLGFDPDVVKTTTGSTMYPEDAYSKPSDTVTVDTNFGAYAPEVQAHEFRHRGMYDILNLYISDPKRFEAEFGTPAAVYAENILKDMRGPQNKLYSEALAEMFEQPSQFNYPRVYYSETGEVIQSGDIDAYRKANPGVETKAVNRQQDGHLTQFLDRNTRPVVEAYRQLQETGEIPAVGNVSSDKMQQFFEGAEGMQSAAEFLLERNPVRGYATGGPADMSAYRKALIASESSGDVGAENPSGAVGLTQAMPETLEDFKDQTGLEFTPEEYANSRELQTQFQDWYEQKTINYIIDQGLDRYIGQTIKGVPITMSSMLGMAHLGGDYGMRKFLETGGRYDPDDGYTKLSDYGRKFANMSIVGQGEVGYKPSPEEILMSMPVKQEDEFTDPRGYSPIPQLRSQYMPTDPMPRPQLRPEPETLVEEEVEEALLQRERPTMVEKYGLPGDLPAGIGSLNQMAKNMYS